MGSLQRGWQTGWCLLWLLYLLILTALTVGSFPAMALTPVARRSKDTYALVHAWVGLAQVHGAFCFCNRHKQKASSGASTEY